MGMGCFFACFGIRDGSDRRNKHLRPTSNRREPVVLNNQLSSVYLCEEKGSAEGIGKDDVDEQLKRKANLAVELKESTDVYLSCRKDAMQMSKAAAKHSRESRTAHSNGDHASAHQLSLKAKRERIKAKKLHAEAAKEILRIKNESNDIWNLDLHGLHKTEAIRALQEHLQDIESQPRPTGLAQEREPVLHVITGKGVHSGGRPVLPGAVRRFLSKNGYQFDGSRPGVIDVCPNFIRD